MWCCYFWRRREEMRENNRKCCLSLKGEKKGGDGGMCVEAVFVVSHARTAHHESTCMHGKQFFSSAHLQQVKKKNYYAYKSAYPVTG